MSQALLCIFGVTAIWLSQSPQPYPRYACFAGLAAQPFWFYETYTAEQWGIFAISFLYTWSWLKGLRMHWL